MVECLQAEGIASAPVQYFAQLDRDPQLDARGFYRTLSSPHVGTLRYTGPELGLTGTPQRAVNGAPGLGQHNAYVLNDILELPTEEIEVLQRDEVIGTRPSERMIPST